MKNGVIMILAITTIVGGYVAATSNFRLNLEGITGKTDKVIRGDLTLPINATGEIKPVRRIEIKSQASGEVIEIAKKAGERVTAGELLIRLQRDDEERNVKRAQLDVDVANARLEETRLRFEQAQTADLQLAQAQVDQLRERVRFARFRLDKLGALSEHQRNEEEVVQRETSYLDQMAQLEAARANLAKAQIAIPRAQQAINQAQATYEAAKSSLGDAEKRLAETDILAPIDGIVASIRTQIGEVIQGGKTTLTGGTVLAVLLDMQRLIVKAEVDESDIGRVQKIAPEWAKPGHDDTQRMPENLDEAMAAIEHAPVITVESFRDEEFHGVIERIYPEPKILTGVVTYLVDVVITSKNRSMLLPGMRADVRFTSEHVADAVLCPNEAIREGPGGRLGVYVPLAGADPNKREIEFIGCKFGLDNGNFSEVREGLAEGTVVYTRLPRRTDREEKRKQRSH